MNGEYSPAIQLSRMTFTDTPDILGHVSVGVISFRVVMALVVITEEWQLIVGIPFVGNDQTARHYRVLNELLKHVSISSAVMVAGNPKRLSACIRLDCAGNDVFGLFAFLFTEVALIRLHESLKQWCRVRYVSSEPCKPPGGSRIADFGLEHCCFGTLPLLPAPQQ